MDVKPARALVLYWLQHFVVLILIWHNYTPLSSNRYCPATHSLP